MDSELPENGTGMEQVTKRQHLTTQQIIKIGNLMEAIIEGASPGTCQYKDNWSDQAVADKFSCSKNSVARMRNELHGILAKPVPLDDPKVMSEHIAQLQQDMSVVLEYMREHELTSKESA